MTRSAVVERSDCFDEAAIVIEQILNRIAAAETDEQRLIAERLLLFRLALLVNHLLVHDYTSVMQAFVAAATAPGTDDLRDAVAAVLDRYTALGVSNAPRRRVVYNDWRISQVLRIVETRFQNHSFRLEDVAKAVGLSVWHTSRLLKRHTRVGFRAHLTRKRVDVAQGLLRDTLLSVKEVAARVGYTKTSHLSARFKAVTGVTPVAFRATCHRTTSNRKRGSNSKNA